MLNLVEISIIIFESHHHHYIREQVRNYFLKYDTQREGINDKYDD